MRRTRQTTPEAIENEAEEAARPIPRPATLAVEALLLQIGRKIAELAGAPRRRRKLARHTERRRYARAARVQHNRKGAARAAVIVSEQRWTVFANVGRATVECGRLKYTKSSRKDTRLLDDWPRLHQRGFFCLPLRWGAFGQRTRYRLHCARLPARPMFRGYAEKTEQAPGRARTGRQRQQAGCEASPTLCRSVYRAAARARWVGQVVASTADEAIETVAVEFRTDIRS